jgi:hypothetical protein
MPAFEEKKEDHIQIWGRMILSIAPYLEYHLNKCSCNSLSLIHSSFPKFEDDPLEGEKELWEPS